MPIRYCEPEGNTREEMKKRLGASLLDKMGPCRLVWVNADDLASASPVEIIDADEKDWREYERLTLKFADQGRALPTNDMVKKP